MNNNWRGSTRARRLPGNWQTLRKRILERDGYTCQIRLDGCTGVATQADHIKAGDDHSPSNLRAACASCNAKANIAARPKAESEKRATEKHPGIL